MKTISQILEFLDIQTSLENNYQIKSLYLDSRKCDSGSSFIALKGLSIDGNKYIDSVLASGVKLVLSDSISINHSSSCHPELDSGSHRETYSLVRVDPGSESGMTTIIYIENLKDKLPALAKWFYDYKKPQNIIGITGTNGKTSISSYIAQLQKLLGQKSLLLGTNGNGIYPNLKESTHTTLDILSLYQIISEYSQSYRHPELDSGSYNNDSSIVQIDSKSESGMKERLSRLASQATPSPFEGEFENLVMEVSSHSLDQKRVEGLDFDVAVFSNLSHDHLDYHKTMDSYFEAKVKLFQFDSLRKAVINIDDEYGKKLYDMVNPNDFCKSKACHSGLDPESPSRNQEILNQVQDDRMETQYGRVDYICSCKVVTVSLKSKNADIYLESKNVENMLTSFDLYISHKFIGTYQTSLVGEFNLMNLGLSIAALDEISIRKQLLENISKLKPVKGRMEVITLANGVKVIIDYAHTPDALEKALQTLADYNPNSLWCIFGCGGDRDTTKRPIMAQIAQEYANKIVVTEDNNRFESIDNIFKDIKKGFTYPDKHIFINSREEAIKYAIANAKGRDVILLAGKGHECYLDKNGVKEHFDEREIIYKYIRG